MTRPSVEVETAAAEGAAVAAAGDVAPPRAPVLFAGYFVIYIVICLAALAVTLVTLAR